jgi:hypothetical protein
MTRSPRFRFRGNVAREGEREQWPLKSPKMTMMLLMMRSLRGASKLVSPFASVFSFASAR